MSIMDMNDVKPAKPLSLKDIKQIITACAKHGVCAFQYNGLILELKAAHQERSRQSVQGRDALVDTNLSQATPRGGSERVTKDDLQQRYETSQEDIETLMIERPELYEELMHSKELADQ